MARRLGRIGLAVTILAAAASGASGQGRTIGDEPSGVRESARFLDQRAVAGRDAELLAAPPAPPPLRLLFTPSAVSAEGVLAYGATLGVISPLRLPLQLRAGYRRLDLAGVDDRQRLSADAKLRLISGREILGRRTALALTGDWTKTVHVSSRYGVSLAAERALDRPARFTLGATGSYVRSDPESAETTSDLVLATGLVYALSEQTEFSLDYEFDNDVAGEDDFSFTVSQLLPVTLSRGATSLVFGAGKHRVVFATLVFVY